MEPRLLVVQNVAWEGPGLVGTYAQAAGIQTVVAKLFRTREAGSMPLDRLEKGAFSAVVGLGSPSTAYLPETNPHHEELAELFKLTRKLKVPSFDICYSMQLFCLVHGGTVVRNPAGKEIGFEEVVLTPQGESDKVFGPVGRFATLQWHGDIVERLPPETVHLGFSRKTENQLAVLDGIHYLVQSDGQASTPDILKSWLEHDSKWATSGTGISRGSLLAEAVRGEAYYRNTFMRVFSNFLALALES